LQAPPSSHRSPPARSADRLTTTSEEIVIPSSLPIIVATAALTLLAALVLAWGWRRGFFRDLDAQSKVIFEPRDWRVERPWESPVQRLEREMRHGDPVPPDRGEWGGAA
jgi:hypothetical protein